MRHITDHFKRDRDDLSGQIAAHYEMAGLAEQALIYYRRAASYARQLYAYDVAISHLQSALALIGEQSHPLRPELYDLLGEIQHLLGKYEDAREAWGCAIIHLPIDDRLWQANLHRKIGSAWRDHYHYDEVLQAYDTAEQSLGNLTDQDA